VSAALIKVALAVVVAGVDDLDVDADNGPRLYDLGESMELRGSPGPDGRVLLASAAPRLDGTWRVWVRGEDLLSPHEHVRPDRSAARALMVAVAFAQVD
jgi:hypothetical protein